MRPEVDNKRMTVKTHIEVIVLFEILIFYFTIFGLMAFLLVSRSFSFKTIRERMDLGGNMRYRRDFLEFVQEDVHYTLIALMEFALFIYVIFHLQNEITLSAGVSMIIISLHMLFQFILIFFIYFRPAKKKVTSTTLRNSMVSYIGTTIAMMVYICINLYLELGDRLYWFPYLMVYLFLKFFIICNIIFE